MKEKDCEHDLHYIGRQLPWSEIRELNVSTTIVTTVWGCSKCGVVIMREGKIVKPKKVIE